MNKAIFFDLQGTLGGEGTSDIRDFEFYSFSIDAIKMAVDNDYLAIAITNQSNIGRGYLSIDDFKNKINKLQSELHKKNTKLNDVFCCPHTNDDKCLCKKPQTTLLEQAIKKYNIDINESFVIGDMGNSDIVMGKFE